MDGITVDLKKAIKKYVYHGNTSINKKDKQIKKSLSFGKKCMLYNKLLKLSKILLAEQADEEQNVAIMIEYYDNFYNAIRKHNEHEFNEMLQYVDVKVNEYAYNYSDTVLKEYLNKTYKISPIAYALQADNLYAFTKLIKLGSDINDETLGSSLLAICAKDKNKSIFAEQLLKNHCKKNDELIAIAKINHNPDFVKIYRKYQ